MNAVRTVVVAGIATLALAACGSTHTTTTTTTATTATTTTTTTAAAISWPVPIQEKFLKGCNNGSNAADCLCLLDHIEKSTPLSVIAQFKPGEKPDYIVKAAVACAAEIR